MKKIGAALLVIFLVFIVFVYTIIRLANWNIERMYKNSSENTFYLVSLIIDHYLKDGKILEDIQIGRIRQMFSADKKVSALIQQEIAAIYPMGYWIFSSGSLATSRHEIKNEELILDFYRRNLQGNNSHAVILLDGKPFYLVNTVTKNHEILVVEAAQGPSLLRINELLDSLILSSNLLYYAVLDSNNSPVILSTLYEDFLPVRGGGIHKIQTLDGEVFHIEEDLIKRKVIAGFSARPLERIRSANNLFFFIASVIFVLLELIFFLTVARFQKFKAAKERQIGLLREISALSTGFAHEFRNSLHTLSLLARDLGGDDKKILTEEIDRMNAVMDSLKLINMTQARMAKVSLHDVVEEAVSLLDSHDRKSSVHILDEVDQKMHVLGQRTMLVTVFSNIIRNSMEANAKKIAINASRQGNDMVITVSDDGEGFDRDTLEHMFDPFFSRKEQSGLGLYLVNRIIGLHGGRITVKRAGETVIKITLKAA